MNCQGFDKRQRVRFGGLALSLDNSQQLCFLGQIGDNINGFTSLVCLGKEIQAAIHHFDRDIGKRPVKRFSDRIGAQLIATGVRTPEQQRLLGRNGVELSCGELFARPDTRLPEVSFAK